jgi:Cyclic nucleotide-binding domain
VSLMACSAGRLSTSCSEGGARLVCAGMPRYLVVANQTLGGESLLAAVRERSRRGEGRLFLIVPATPPSGGLTWTESQASLLARDRLERWLKQFAEMGVDVEGQVGDPDPFLAVQDVLQGERFDEIIVSTLPRGKSQWLKANLPERLRAAVDVQVTHVTAPPELETKGRTLRQVPLLADVPRRRLRALSKAAVTREYFAGDTVVHAGSTESDLFVMVDGRATVHRQGRTVATLTAGDFFGEISLLDPGPRTADVVAESPTKCIRLAGKDFWQVVEADPRLANVLLRHLGRRLREIVQPLAD